VDGKHIEAAVIGRVERALSDAGLEAWIREA